MLNSQWLEVAIGLVLTFFLISLASSMIVEVIARLLSKRASDLTRALQAMLGERATARQNGVPQTVADTAVFERISAVSGRSLFGNAKGPSYLSAKGFADAASEILIKAGEATSTASDLADALPKGLRDRLQPIVVEVGDDLTAIKAELESWFDQAMERVEGSYKRWAQAVLFCVGLGLVVFGNASASRIAIELYNDPVVSDAVASVAANIAIEPDADAAQIDAVVKTIEDAKDLGMPIGWKDWNSGAGSVGTVFGWGLTAILVMLGAPFWYDLLTKLVSLRSAGSKPSTAPGDPGSATAMRNLALSGRGAGPAARAASTGPAALARPGTPSTWQEALRSAVVQDPRESKPGAP